MLREENDEQLKAFLQRTPDAEVTTPREVNWGRPAGDGRQLLPEAEHHDGFFYARLRRQG